MAQLQHQMTDVLPLAEFRLVVFRPFKGEVIMAKISKCTPEGIHGKNFHAASSLTARGRSRLTHSR